MKRWKKSTRGMKNQIECEKRKKKGIKAAAQDSRDTIKKTERLKWRIIQRKHGKEKEV